MTKSLVAAPLLVAVATSSALAQGLQIGDVAPPLSIVEWVKGRPIDLKRDARKRIHVVEFWAVWCPPCKMSVPLLTELQKKYGKDIVIVGVTEPDMRGNSPSAIRQFDKEQGKTMQYTVAIDDGKTMQGYLASAGVVGTPHAFVVNKEGRIVWQGSPLEPALDEVLSQVVSGKFDLEAAKVQHAVRKRLDEVGFLAQMGQWRGVWDGLVEILKLDPANEVGLDALIAIATEELKDTETLRKWVNTHLQAHGTNVQAMQRLAIALCSIRDLGSRCPDLALDAAKAAFAASKRPDALTIAGYARALYQIGELDRAITLQQDAVAVALDDQKDSIKGTLNYYRMCKKLQGTVD